jgi:hypothetical protein
MWAELEDTKVVIKLRKSKKGIQHNDQKKKDKQRLAMQYVNKLDIEQYEAH